MVSRVVLIVLLLLLGACAAAPERSSEVYERNPETPTPAAVPPEQTDPGQRRASSELVVRARSARQEGNFDRAEALLQRAQRLEASNPEIYLELAELYAERGQSGSAQAAAERGLLYCESGGCHRLRELAQP